MRNVLTKGTQPLQRAGKLYFPANEDRCMVAQVNTVSVSGLTVSKIWDLADNKKDFDCSVQYAGKVEAPIETSCEVDTYLPIHRIDKDLYTAFLPYSFIPAGVPALVAGAQGFSREDYGERVNCGVTAEWQLTNLRRITSYKVFNRDDNAIKVNAYDAKKIFIKKSANITHFRKTVENCESIVGNEVVYRPALLPAYLDGTERVWCIDGLGDLSPGTLCDTTPTGCSDTALLTTDYPAQPETELGKICDCTMNGQCAWCGNPFPTGAYNARLSWNPPGGTGQENWYVGVSGSCYETFWIGPSSWVNPNGEYVYATGDWFFENLLGSTLTISNSYAYCDSV